MSVSHMKDETQIKESKQLKQNSIKPKLPVCKLGIVDNLYEAIIHNALDAFFITNFQGDILEVNNAVCCMEGYSREELLSMSLMDLDIEFKEDPQPFIDYQHSFVKAYEETGGKFNSIYNTRKHKRKDGRIIDVEVSYHYLGPESNLFFHFNRDITERKQSEEKIRESKEFIENVIASMRDGFSIMDTQGTYIDVNDSFCQMTGFTREELIGNGPPYLFWPEEYIQENNGYLGKTLKGKFSDRETIFKRKSGERFPVIISPSCLRDKEGKIINIFATIKDITEHKRFETEQILRQETEETLRQRMEFTRALAHELKTPLTPLVATSELLLSEAAGEPIVSYARNINAGAQELNRRIGDLLDMARGEIGGIDLELREMDLLPVIENVVDYIMPEVVQSGLTLNMDITPPLPKVMADKQRVRQILLNLLDNSIKYTRRGGSIDVRTSEENGFIVTTVTDTGYGIAKKDRDSLFKPYTHLDGKGGKYRGLGLGLALSKMFVELHGGRIWQESRDEKGSAFSFTLPVCNNIRKIIKK